jgi:hypothetical protein
MDDFGHTPHVTVSTFIQDFHRTPNNLNEIQDTEQ